MDGSRATRTAVVTALRAAGCVFAEDEARLLLRADRDGTGELAAMLARRVAGEPLEVVLGWAAFRGLRIGVRAGVFVPRRRTSFLVDRAKPLLRSGDVLVDLCCGTGAVALALATEVAGLDVHAADIDPVAVACARDNLTAVGAEVHQGDLYEALPAALAGRVTVLAVNAPYVPTGELAAMPPEARDHEPQVALDGGSDGVEMHRRVATGALDWLAPDGRLLIETSRGQAPLTGAAMTGAGLRAVVRRSRDGYTAVVVGARTPLAAQSGPR
jgi:release factor glutamine methyltransferase